MRRERAIIKNNKESVLMKRLLVIVLALTFVFAFAVSAMAAQAPGSANGTNYGTSGTPTGNPVGGTIDAQTTQASSAYSGGVTSPNGNLLPGPTANSPNKPYLGVGNVDNLGTSVARIHSGFTSNTNACAACHATHTAVGNDLLQWTNSQQACEACHDGSLGVTTYNVLDGKIANTGAYTKAGRFYTGTDVDSKSMHNVGAGLQLSAAPGGLGSYAGTSAITTAGTGAAASTSQTLNLTANMTGTNGWGSEFECVSCHTPHGAGGNSRILNPDLNGSALYYTNQALVAVPADGANTYAAIIPATGVIKTRSATDTLTQPSPDAGDWAMMLTAPYPKGVTVYYNGTTAATMVMAASQLVDQTKYMLTEKNGRTEIVFGGTPSNPTVNFYAGLKVKMTINNYLTSSESVTYNKGFNDFCGACHTDYNTSKYYSTGGTNTWATQKTDKTGAVITAYYWLDKEGKAPLKVASHAVDFQTGVFNQAFRHTVGMDTGSYAEREAYGMKFETVTAYKSTAADGTGINSTPVTVRLMSCITCHVSHGTDSGYWASEKADPKYTDIGQFNGSEVFDATNTTGNNRGSELKRMPNMATCETCHRKGLGQLGHDEGYGF